MLGQEKFLEKYLKGCSMKKNLFFISILGIAISLFLFGQVEARTEKTERLGKIVADTMPSGVALKWDDPAGFEKVIVVRNTGRLPQNSSDGEIIYSGSGKNYTDTDLRSGATYYYAIFFIPKKVTYVARTIEIITKPIESFQKVPEPAKATVVSASAGSQMILLFGMFDSLKDFWFTIFRAVQALLIFLGLRSKKKSGWGLVYDWGTKEPLKNVTLSLISERKEHVASVVTDESGRFGFLVEEGNYFLEVGKFKDYEFRPAAYNETDIFGKVYRGEILSIKNEELLVLNVPLFMTVSRTERAKGSWLKKLDFTKIKSSKIINFIVEFSFWIGFAFILLSLVGDYTWWKLAIVIFYVAVFLVRFYLMRVIKQWGLVLSGQDKKPVPFAVVRAFHPTGGNKEQVAVSVSNSKGGFYLLVPPDTYDVSIKGRTLEGVNFDNETKIAAKKGVINGVYYI